MPIIQINLYEGRSQAEKIAICRSIQDAIKQALSITHDNFHHRICEFNDSTLLIPPGRSKNYIMIEINMLPGRDEALKLEMFRKIEANLKQFNISSDDILIICHDPSLENWYIRGKSGIEMRSK
ncbi:MAG: tautomerase family protein [Desulfomonile tiedjei]|nr:tautomerase family protein [Desulfomonile tiedjei]